MAKKNLKTSIKSKPQQVVKKTVGIKPKAVLPSFSFQNDFKKLLQLKYFIIYWKRSFSLLFRKTKPDFTQPNNFIYRVIFCFLLTSSLFVFLANITDYNITWDEKIHVSYSKDVVKYYTSFGKDTTLFDYSKSMYQPMSYYGCSFDLITSFISLYILPSVDEFYVRHTVNALFGLFAILITSLIARFLGGWRTACIAFIFCVLSPSLFGHSMNNPKDIPFAAAFIFAIYQIIRLLHQMPRPKVTTMILIAVGIGWTISTRAGGLILIPFFGLFLGMNWLMFARKKGINVAFNHIIKYACYVALPSIGGYFLGLLIWPYGQKKPLSNPIDALNNLSNVNYLHTYENFEGKRIYMSNVPWYYVLKQISLGAPLFILIGCFLSVALWYFMRKKLNYNYLLLLFFVFAFPIFWVAYKKSMVYNGWRHFLFVYLTLIVVASLGWDFLIFQINKKVIQIIAGLALVGLCVNVMAFMIRNHPNEYIYFNELAGGAKGAAGNYEMDYYSNSVKEAVEWLIANEHLEHKYAKVVTNNELLTINHWSEKLADSVQIVWTRDYERYKQDWDYAIFTSRTYSPSQIKKGYYPPKGTIKTIDVDGVPVCAIVKRPHKLLSQGFAFSSKGGYQEALPYFKAAVKVDSLDEEAWRMAGLCLLNINKLDSALLFINKAIELNPEGFMAYYLKGYYYLSIRDEANAEQMFKESIKNRINNGDAHAELGNIYLNRGLTSPAIEEYKNALGFGNVNPNTYTNMGVAYMNIQDYEAAINLFNMAINKNPNFMPAYEQMALCFEKAGDPQTAAQIRKQIGR
ncbi:MAG: tetratricopeptide repeat protein [Bacteroidota bacterium]|nr:tetratricopeptide repeat protein [Bacteroidota bacterium]